MEYNTIELLFEEAVKLAAKENKERDMRVMGECDDENMYLEEARVVLEETGENYLPEFKDHHHITVKKNI